MPISQAYAFFSDREYYLQLFRIGFPLAFQNLVLSCLNLVGVLMIGQLGETSVAAVGLANQVFFLLNLLLFGITSGMAIFTAQLWGKGDIRNIRRVTGLSLGMSLLSGLFFFIVAVVFPRVTLSIYSPDAEVVELGSQYLRIAGWSYLFTAITISYASILRSIGDVKTPLVVSLASLSLSTGLSYVLIFGKFGFPILGVQGAAWSVVIARIIECVTLLWLVYRMNSPVAASITEMLSLDWSFIINVLRPVLPVAFNELLWSFGVTIYNLVYARIGTGSIAAMNIVSSIDGIAMVVFIGLANATAILVGNYIGAGEEEKAYIYAGRSILLGVIGAVIMGGIISVFSPAVLGLYKVSTEVILIARRVLIVLSVIYWIRVTNMVQYLGAFRSGGDTRFAFVMDGVVIWVVGVPLALIGGLVFNLPVYWVYLLVMTEEFTKWLVGLIRFSSKKWINNLAQTV